MVKRKVKLTQNVVHSVSSQKYHGTRTGIAIASNTNNGSYKRFCHITIGSSSKSLMSTIFRLATTSGCGVRNSQPMWAKKNPRRASCGSASVSEYLWWTRWSCAQVYASRCKKKQKCVKKKKCSCISSQTKLTCPEIVKRNVKSKRNCHFALYALCDHRRWAPAVMPKPDPMIRAKTFKWKKT